MLKRYRLDNKRSVLLEDYNPKDTADFKVKEDVQELFDKLRNSSRMNRRSCSPAKQTVSWFFFKAWTAAAKTVSLERRLPALIRKASAESFKQPTSDEAAHDFLWRTHKVTPAKGYINAFNRSYYEEVLTTKVHGLIDSKEADKRLKHIQHFEKLLTDSGILIIKIFLHISPEFQLDKIKERMETPRNCGNLIGAIWRSVYLEEGRYQNYLRMLLRLLEPNGTRGISYLRTTVGSAIIWF